MLDLDNFTDPKMAHIVASIDKDNESAREFLTSMYNVIRVLEQKGHIHKQAYNFINDKNDQFIGCWFALRGFEFNFDLDNRILSISARKNTNQEKFIESLAINQPSSPYSLKEDHGKVSFRAALFDVSRVFNYTVISILKNDSYNIVNEIPEVGAKVYNEEGTCTGIYMGEQEIEYERFGLKKIFDLYAAPTKLLDDNDESFSATYNKMQKTINDIQDWHGFHGEAYSSEELLKLVLLNGQYQGGWFIPTKDMLVDYIYNNQNTDVFNEMYEDKKGWYWSCSEGQSGRIFNIILRTGKKDWDLKNNEKIKVHPVRAVPRY